MHVCRLRMYSYMKDPIIKEQKCICNILLCEQGQGFLRPFYLTSIKENLEKIISILFIQVEPMDYENINRVGY